jgi:hypothetical protein
MEDLPSASENHVNPISGKVNRMFGNWNVSTLRILMFHSGVAEGSVFRRCDAASRVSGYRRFEGTWYVAFYLTTYP